MEEKGSKQVPIAQLDDKRQMNVLFSCTKSGEMLPQLLIQVYQGGNIYVIQPKYFAGPKFAPDNSFGVLGPMQTESIISDRGIHTHKITAPTLVPVTVTVYGVST